MTELFVNICVVVGIITRLLRGDVTGMLNHFTENSSSNFVKLSIILLKNHFAECSTFGKTMNHFGELHVKHQLLKSTTSVFPNCLFLFYMMDLDPSKLLKISCFQPKVMDFDPLKSWYVLPLIPSKLIVDYNETL